VWANPGRDRAIDTRDPSRRHTSPAPNREMANLSARHPTPPAARPTPDRTAPHPTTLTSTHPTRPQTNVPTSTTTLPDESPSLRKKTARSFVGEAYNDHSQFFRRCQLLHPAGNPKREPQLLAGTWRTLRTSPPNPIGDILFQEQHSPADPAREKSQSTGIRGVSNTVAPPTRCDGNLSNSHYSRNFHGRRY